MNIHDLYVVSEPVCVNSTEANSHVSHCHHYVSFVCP